MGLSLNENESFWSVCSVPMVKVGVMSVDVVPVIVAADSVKLEVVVVVVVIAVVVVVVFVVVVMFVGFWLPMPNLIFLSKPSIMGTMFFNTVLGKFCKRSFNQ